MNCKGTDQTAQMRRLVCAIVVRLQQSQVFLSLGPNTYKFGRQTINVHRSLRQRVTDHYAMCIKFENELIGFPIL